MMGLYVVYVLVVVVGRYIYQTHMKPKKAGINMKLRELEEKQEEKKQEREEMKR